MRAPLRQVQQHGRLYKGEYKALKLPGDRDDVDAKKTSKRQLQKLQKETKVKGKKSFQARQMICRQNSH